MTDEQEAEANSDRARELAAQAVDPCVTGAVALAAFWTSGDEPVDLQPAYDAVQRQVQEVKRGKLACVEATLVGQAVALNGMFVDLAQRGQANLGQAGTLAERYLRLALKAQNQCRATLDTLGSSRAGRPRTWKSRFPTRGSSASLSIPTGPTNRSRTARKK